ncbi:heavy-metal-associated domain-containing protein [Pseudomonas sp. MPDS]|uniref:heavy-metal-associated domain-containing protein n=1 Tax=Pseudomonas sp. MPDS TaxID=2762896 RepID=UPI001563AF31|nr:heavy-metal-associated domain-containing protein [Pseudomonas sp. MPDS]QKJ36066.1 cation transporter [Pseudomonas sp. MPDS]
MGWGSCVNKITKVIQSLDQNARVEVDRAAGKVTVESIESAESIRITDGLEKDSTQ